jgi:uncharacterized protein (DUF2252 family)
MAAGSGARSSIAARQRRGTAMRAELPHELHAAWAPQDRRDPISLLREQDADRSADLVPVRYERMLATPSTYFRGAALPMASDLAQTPATGVMVQCCGDAHLSNFGIFGSPERHLFFDVNDFDETARGPWEWDVKRLTASIEIAGRVNGFTAKERRHAALGTVASYRLTMRELAHTPMLDVWYVHLDLDDLVPRFRALLDPKRTPTVWRTVARARAHDNLQAFGKLCHVVDGEPRIRSNPPFIVPIEELDTHADHRAVSRAMASILLSYEQTLEPQRRHLVDHYRFVHLARKVVGVGSVGMRCWIALFLERHRNVPLLLQIKEAAASVLERYTSKSGYPNHGQRVVEGQRLMQAASDIFLGWGHLAWAGEQRDCYVRQLRDWKGSVDVAGMTPAGLGLWGEMCGWALARAHARSGDRVGIASYLGKSDSFDRALAEFAAAYADTNEADHGALRDAVTAGRMTVGNPTT